MYICTSTAFCTLSNRRDKMNKKRVRKKKVIYMNEYFFLSQSPVSTIQCLFYIKKRKRKENLITSEYFGNRHTQENYPRTK